MNDERLMDHQRLHRQQQAGQQQAAKQQAGQPAHDRLVRPCLATDPPSAALTRIALMTYPQQPSGLRYPNASHTRLVDAFTDWIVQRVDELVALNQGLPLVIPLTVTFSLGSIRPDRALREYERFYARLCDRLVNNHERPSKHHLLPFALAFRDDPSTRPGKHRDRPSAFAVFSNHPTVAPHVHSLLVVHPTLADRFMGIVDALEATWRGIPVRMSSFDAPTYVNRSLHADVPFALTIRELMAADPLGSRALVRARIRRVVDYCAKLGRRRRDDVDLFTVLPTSPRHSVPTVQMGLVAAVDHQREERGIGR
jgi:hypothetical protein